MSEVRTASTAISVAALGAVVAGGATLAFMPPSVFRAVSIVAVDEPSPGLRTAAARGAASFAVSKPVIVRAAASLNGTELAVPTPGFADRLGVAVGLKGASSGVARLAAALGPTIAAHAGDGIVEIEAEADDAARAARIAGAVADALVVEEEAATAAVARRGEAAASAQLETLRATARAAHQHLSALGGTEADPALALAAAATATRTAEAHLAAVRAVVAAGSPPLGAGADLPQSAAALQQTYWDLKKQLDKAVESMGERHTTVIALRDGVSRAAASLTAEWRRIEHAAEGDVTVAKGREAALRKAGAAQDPDRRIAIDEARRAAGLADAAVARVTAAAAPAQARPLPFRVVAQAASPASAAGFPDWQRALATGAAGAAAAAIAVAMLRRRRRPAVEKVERVPRPVDVPVAAPTVVPEISPASRTARAEPVHAASTPLREMRDHDFQHHDFQHHDFQDYDFFERAAPRDAGYENLDQRDERTDAMPFESLSFDQGVEAPRAGAAGGLGALDRDLRDALRAIAADLGTAKTRRGLTTVLVGSNTAGADSGAIALALGEASAELGHRVLVVECEHARAALAEAVEPGGEPILVDAYGALRVALPAERIDDLFLAPALRNGARIASALARNTQAELVDDLALAFDAVVIDAGRASDAVAAGWTADAFIRVGRFASQRDDEHFLALFGAPAEALLGTVAAGRFVPQEAPEPVVRAAAVSSTGRPALRAVPGTREEAVSSRRPASVTPRDAPRRRIAGR